MRPMRDTRLANGSSSVRSLPLYRISSKNEYTCDSRQSCKKQSDSAAAHIDHKRNETVELVLYILAKSVQLFLSAISLCMFMTVILQFFVNPEESKAYRLFSTITEFVVFPFRVIMAKLNLFQGTPIDMPFLFAYLTVSLISMLMPVI